MFERITGEHIHKRMAIVLDGKVHSAPTIQSRIGGGKASITGSFTPTERRTLSHRRAACWLASRARDRA